MFGKHFATMYTGSMVGAGPVVFAVWGYAISNASREGTVEINPSLLAVMLGTTADEIVKAIGYLEAPDPNSRSKTEDGKRMVKEGQFLYRLPNYHHYRSLRDADDRREYQKRLMAERRAADRVLADVSQSEPRLAHAEADAEVDVEADAKKQRKNVGRDELNWRVEETWGVYLKARKRWCDLQERPYRAPVLDPKTRSSIVASIKQHDCDRMSPEQRDQWVRESPVRAAGIGLWYSAWHTASDPKNDIKNGGHLYCLEPWRPWFQQQNKPDPVTGFAELYWEKKDAQARREAAAHPGNGR